MILISLQAHHPSTDYAQQQHWWWLQFWFMSLPLLYYDVHIAYKYMSNRTMAKGSGTFVFILQACLCLLCLYCKCISSMSLVIVVHACFKEHKPRHQRWRQKLATHQRPRQRGKRRLQLPSPRQRQMLATMKKTLPHCQCWRSLLPMMSVKQKDGSITLCVTQDSMCSSLAIIR